MAAKILANLIVMGSGILARAFVQAYRQALASKARMRELLEIIPYRLIRKALQKEDFFSRETRININSQDASKTGVAHETIQNVARRGSKVMTEQEARQILGVTEQSSWEEIVQKYDNLFENNAKNGSFYLQSKVHRAKECLETLYQVKDEDTAG